MIEKNRSLVFGVLIIILGIVLLLHNTRIIPSSDDFFGGIFFLVVSFICFRFFKQNPRNWWIVIPALFCLLFAISLLFKNFYFYRDDLLGVAIFWCAAFAFGYIYYRDKKKWWGIIPSGTCFTLGTVVLLDVLDLTRPDFGGIVFFLGIGLTFIYLWTQANSVNKLKWAIYPAVGCLVLALFLYIESATRHGFDLFFSILLILIGLYFIIRPYKKK